MAESAGQSSGVDGKPEDHYTVVNFAILLHFSSDDELDGCWVSDPSHKPTAERPNLFHPALEAHLQQLGEIFRSQGERNASARSSAARRLAFVVQMAFAMIKGGFSDGERLVSVLRGRQAH